MGMRLRVFLTSEEDRTLRELRRATTIPQRVKDRADVVRMSARGDYVETIAAYFNWHVETVRKTLKRWQIGGLGGLWEAPGRGKPRCWQEADMAYLEEVLRTDEQTYTAPQLAEKLFRDRQVRLSPGHLREVLEKKGVIWKRTRHSHRRRQDPEQRATKTSRPRYAGNGRGSGGISTSYTWTNRVAASGVQ